MTTVLQAILAATKDARVRAGMALGALLEGGSLGAGPFPTGDQGTSFGPFQIHLPAHPGVTSAQASDPSAAVAFMLPAYMAGVAGVPADAWTSEPQLAAEMAAMAAERPAEDYYTRAGAVQGAWPTVTKALATGNLSAGSGGSTTTPGAAGSGSGSTAAPVGLLPSIPSASDIGAAITKALTIAAVVAGGAGLVILGVNKAAGNPAGKAAKAAAPVAAAAAL